MFGHFDAGYMEWEDLKWLGVGSMVREEVAKSGRRFGAFILLDGRRSDTVW
jgi:hypothetical protein